MKKRTFTRCLSILLTLVMVFGLVPMAALADDDPMPTAPDGWQVGDAEDDGNLYVKTGDASPMKDDDDDDGFDDDFAIEKNPVNLMLDVEEPADGTWYLEEVELEYTVNGVPAEDDLEYDIDKGEADKIADFASITSSDDKSTAAVSFTGTIPNYVWEELQRRHPGAVIKITDVEIEAEYKKGDDDWDVELHNPTGWEKDFREDLNYTVEIYLDGELAESVPGTCKPDTELTITPDAIDGYVFDHSDPADRTVTITEDGEVFKLYYLSDVMGGGEDGHSKDDIADEYEAFVFYETDGNGTVTKAFEVHDLRTSAGLMTEVALDGSTANPNEGFAFENWTGDGLPEGAGKAAALVGTLTGVTGNSTYTFTASFEQKTEPVDDPVVPELDVDKEADVDEAAIGETITYTITVKNEGSEAVDAVVTETLDGAVFAGDKTQVTLENLAPEETRTLTVTYVVKEADITTDDDGEREIENKVLVTVGEYTFDDDEDVDVVDKTDDWHDGDLISPQNSDELTGGDEVDDKQQAKVIYKVAEGQEAMGDVIVCKLGSSVADSGYEIVTLTTTGWNAVYGCAAAPTEGHKFVKWTLDGADFTMSPENVADKLQAGETITFIAHFAAIPEEPAESTLSVTKTDGKADDYVYAAGETVTWTITVKNTGNAECTNVVVTEQEGVTILAGTGYTVKGGKAKIAALAAGASVEIKAQYTITEADLGDGETGTYMNIAAAKADNAPKAKGSDTVATAEKFVAQYDLEVEKTSKQTEVKVGETITWTVTVTNTGNIDLEDILVKDLLEGAEIAPAEGVTLNDDGTATIEALAVGAVKNLTVTYKTTEEGKVANTVEASTEDASDTDTADEIPVKPADAPAIEVIKRPCAINGRLPKADYTVEAGDVVTWQITVKNVGNTDLEDLQVKDVLYVDGEAVKLDLKDEDGDRVTTFDLKAGKERILFADYKVVSADEGEWLHNTVIVENDDAEDEDDDKSFWVNDDILPSLNKDDHIAYIIGYEDNTVRPQNSITRAEVATIFFRLLDDNSRAYYWSKTNDFKDVNRDDWFNNAISTMSNARVIKGYPDGAFHPNAPITRAEFAAIAARFSDVVYDGKSPFSDVLPTHWANDEIVLAQYLGWIEGYPDGTFHPDQNITRAEAMTLINRVLERAVEHDHMLKDMIHWVDNPKTAWYYEAVQEATNSHTYGRLNKRVPGQDFNYEDWSTLIENPDWEALEKTWSDANDQ